MAVRGESGRVVGIYSGAVHSARYTASQTMIDENRCAVQNSSPPEFSTSSENGYELVIFRTRLRILEPWCTCGYNGSRHFC